jgi:hypothetical protein
MSEKSSGGFHFGGVGGAVNLWRLRGETGAED